MEKFDKPKEAPAPTTEEEEPVVFDSSHYKNGLNGDFMSNPDNNVLELFTGRFEDPEKRDIANNKSQIIDMLKTECGPFNGSEVLGDVGSGTGLMLDVFSSSGVGSVMAFDISPVFCEALKGRCVTEKMDNVSVSQCSSKALGCPDESLNIAILVDVYHHLEYPLTFNRSLLNSLKPNGKLVILKIKNQTRTM